MRSWRELFNDPRVKGRSLSLSLMSWRRCNVAKWKRVTMQSICPHWPTRRCAPWNGATTAGGGGVQGHREIWHRAEKLFFDKIIEFYENLSVQIQEVDPHFPLDQVKVMSDVLRWKKKQSERNTPSPDVGDKSIFKVVDEFITNCTRLKHKNLDDLNLLIKFDYDDLWMYKMVSALEYDDDPVKYP